MLHAEQLALPASGDQLTEEDGLERRVGDGVGRRRLVRAGRVPAEHVAVQAVTDALDRLPGGQFGGPQVARDDVVDQRAHVPASTRGARVPAIGRDARLARDLGVEVELPVFPMHRDEVSWPDRVEHLP